jgi:hypothetical protein
MTPAKLLQKQNFFKKIKIKCQKSGVLLYNIYSQKGGISPETTSEKEGEEP